MAWYAIIEADLSPTSENVLLPVTYYDDAIADATTATGHKHVFDHVFIIPVGAVLRDVRDMVVERGQTARTAQEAAVRLRAVFPIGKTVPVP